MKHANNMLILALAVTLAFMCSVTAFAEDLTSEIKKNEAPANTPSTSSETSEPTTSTTESSSSSWGLLSGESLKETFMTLFTNTIANFFSGIINSIIDLVDEFTIKLLDSVFHAEDLVNAKNGTVLSAASLKNVYNFIYLFACALVALKFIFKGFQIYILWRGGDADASPRDMAIGVVEATIVMVSFPWLYERIVDVFKYLAEGIMGRLGVAELSAGYFAPLKAIITISTGGTVTLFTVLLRILFLLIFFIMLFVLWIKLIRQGFELLIMRLGVPLAALGLVDSDMALFKNYFQTLLKVGLTVIIQVSLMALAFRVILTADLICILASIALMSTAMSAPRLMQNFLAPQAQGGGMMNKAYSTAMILHAGKMLFV